MKKKIFSILMSLMMLVSFMPAMTFESFADTTTTYTKITDISSLQDGHKYIITEDDNDYYGLSSEKGSYTSSSSTYNGLTDSGSLGTSSANIGSSGNISKCVVFTLIKSGDNWKFKTSDNKYLTLGTHSLSLGTEEVALTVSNEKLSSYGSTTGNVIKSGDNKVKRSGTNGVFTGSGSGTAITFFEVSTGGGDTPVVEETSTYKLVSSITAGKHYIITDTNAESTSAKHALAYNNGNVDQVEINTSKSGSDVIATISSANESKAKFVALTKSTLGISIDNTTYKLGVNSSKELTFGNTASEISFSSGKLKIGDYYFDHHSSGTCWDASGNSSNADTYLFEFVEGGTEPPAAEYVEYKLASSITTDGEYIVVNAKANSNSEVSAKVLANKTGLNVDAKVYKKDNKFYAKVSTTDESNAKLVAQNDNAHLCNGSKYLRVKNSDSTLEFSSTAPSNSTSYDYTFNADTTGQFRSKTSGDYYILYNSSNWKTGGTSTTGDVYIYEKASEEEGGEDPVVPVDPVVTDKTSVDTLAFTSDAHNKNDYSTNRVKTWISTVAAGENDLIDMFSTCGDNGNAGVDFGPSNHGKNYWKEANSFLDAINNTSSYIKKDGVLIAGNHEWQNGDIGDTTYNTNNRVVYTVDEKADATDDHYEIFNFGVSANRSNGFTSDDIAKLDSYLKNNNGSKPIFILSHFPLHNEGKRSNYTQGGADVISTINKYSKGKTIVFLWGHTHTDAPSSETNYDKIKLVGSEVGNSTIDFNYAAAGCMSDADYSSTGSGDVRGKGLIASINTSTKEVELSYYANSEKNGTTFTETSFDAENNNAPLKALIGTGDESGSDEPVVGETSTYKLASSITAGKHYIIADTNKESTSTKHALAYTSGKVNQVDINTSKSGDDVIATISTENENNAKFVALTDSSLGITVNNTTYKLGVDSSKNLTFGDTASEISFSSGKLKIDNYYFDHHSSGTCWDATSTESNADTYLYELVEEETPEEMADLDTTADTLAFTSDVHNQDNSTSAKRLANWLDKVAAKENDRFEAVGACGDYADKNSTNYWNNAKVTLDAIDNSLSVADAEGAYVCGNHEYQSGKIGSTSNSVTGRIKKDVGVIKTDDDYVIYGFGVTGSSSDYNYNAFASADIKKLETYLKTAPKDRPIFILSHYPLCQESRTISNANDVIKAINNNSKDRTIIFLWGHNHGEAAKTGSGKETHYDSVITDKIGNTDIDFTYAAAGCMNDTELGDGGNSITGKGLVAKINKTTHAVQLKYYDISNNAAASGTAIKGDGHCAESESVAVTGVSLSETSMSLVAGTTGTLTATVAPEGATNKNVTWSTSNSGVATVVDGVVTAKSAGNATITVKTADGNKTATCAVTVTAQPIAVTGVALDKQTMSLVAGKTGTLSPVFTPSNATNKNVTWSSDDTTVATVNGGTVTAVAAGTATITVTTEDGNKTATCVVTVTPAPVAVTGVTLDQSTMTLVVGSTETLNATVAPSDAANKNVTWSTSNPSVATVVGGVVTAKAAGSATITVTTEDGNKTATCVVNVKKFIPTPENPQNYETSPLTTGIPFALSNVSGGKTYVLCVEDGVVSTKTVSSYEVDGARYIKDETGVMMDSEWELVEFTKTVYVPIVGTIVMPQSMTGYLLKNGEYYLAAEGGILKAVDNTADATLWGIQNNTKLKTVGVDINNGSNYYYLSTSNGYFAVSTTASNACDLTCFKTTKKDVPKMTPTLTLSATTLYYNGKAQAPTAKTNSNGAVTVQKGTKPGTYTVKVAESDRYSAISKTYKIAIKPTSIKSLKKASKAFTVKVGKLASAYATGYQVRYSLKSSMSGAKTKTISTKYSKVSKKFNKLKKKKNYYVQVRTYKTISGKKYYSAWSAKKKVKTK